MIVAAGIFLLLLTAASIYFMANGRSWLGSLLWVPVIYGWVSWSYFAFMVPQ